MTVLSSTPPSRSWPASRFTGLDGIRGLAIIGVLIVHAGIRFPGGAIGPDIFFTLSGFVITHALVSDHERWGRIFLRRFYARRATRILPPVFVAIALAVVARLLFGANTDGEFSLAESTLAVLLYVPNWFEALTLRSLGYLAQTWTLGIEEQFYIFYPLVLLAVVGHKRGLMFVVCAGWVTSTSFRLFLALGTDRVHIFEWSPARFDMLFAGAALYLAWRRSRFVDAVLKHPVAGYLGCTGLAALVCDYPSDRGMVLFGYTLASLATALLVGHLAANKDSELKSVFNSPAANWLGVRSYGIYMYNWPIACVVLKQSLSPWLSLTCSVAGTLVIAEMSHRWLEVPLRALARQREATRPKSRHAAGRP